jgi:ergothioneine biosynthesis protein EgtB
MLNAETATQGKAGVSGVGVLSATPELLLRHYLEVRRMTLRLTEQLSAEDQMLQSMSDASPTKWHLAHTTWFFETFILEPVPGYSPFDSRFRFLFNSYYKQLGGHPLRGARGLMSRPLLSTVHEYRKHVDEAMVAVLESAQPEEVLRLVELGINHEQQHQELILTDIKHALSYGLLRERTQKGTPLAQEQSAPQLTWIDHPGGLCSIGHAGQEFAFDNEGPSHEVMVRPFRIASRPVTNAEFHEFILDGGYRRPELWLSDGWDTVCSQHWSEPLYWEHDGDDIWTQSVYGELEPLNLNDPVCHVSYYEADAYARWRGARLPSEQEWEVVARRNPARGTLLEDMHLNPQPAQGEGLQQVLGDVWEWTASPYVAYPGYRPAAGVLGEYNGKFMCNQMVLRGGSCATPASHIRATYRNFFPPHARWQFSGIRMANDCS